MPTAGGLNDIVIAPVDDEAAVTERGGPSSSASERVACGPGANVQAAPHVATNVPLQPKNPLLYPTWLPFAKNPNSSPVSPVRR